MTDNLSAAQQTQLDNRDSTGQWKAKTHADVDDTAAVLGVDDPADAGEPMPVNHHPSDENEANVSEAIDELGITGASESLGHYRMGVGEYRESYAVTLCDRDGAEMRVGYVASVNDRDAAPSVNRVLGAVVEDAHVYDETADTYGDHFNNWCEHYGFDPSEAEVSGDKDDFEAIGEQRDQLVEFLGEDGYEHVQFGGVFENGREDRNYDEDPVTSLDETVESIHDIDPAHDIEDRDYEEALGQIQSSAYEAIQQGRVSDVKVSYEATQSKVDEFRAMDMEDHAEREAEVADRLKIELDDAAVKS